MVFTKPFDVFSTSITDYSKIYIHLNKEILLYFERK